MPGVGGQVNFLVPHCSADNKKALPNSTGLSLSELNSASELNAVPAQLMFKHTPDLRAISPIKKANSISGLWFLKAFSLKIEVMNWHRSEDNEDVSVQLHLQHFLRIVTNIWGCCATKYFMFHTALPQIINSVSPEGSWVEETWETWKTILNFFIPYVLPAAWNTFQVHLNQ